MYPREGEFGMPSHAFVTVDVFTDRRFGGNPLAVFPDARGLSDGDMQALAREFNLSETTFVLPPEDPAHTAKVRIFTPAHELGFAGHPNVGTGFVLAQQGRGRDGVLLFEEAAGLVEVRIERGGDGEIIGATIAAPQTLRVGATLDAGSAASCVGLEPADIVLAAHAPVMASVGLPFLLVEVSEPALSRAAPDAAAFGRVVREAPTLDARLNILSYAHAPGGIRARMFAPLEGVPEDPATGSAAAALAALLLSHGAAPGLSLDIVQGVEMGRPSLLRTSARRDADGIRASVGGGCVPMLRGEVLS